MTIDAVRAGAGVKEIELPLDPPGDVPDDRRVPAPLQAAARLPQGGTRQGDSVPRRDPRDRPGHHWDHLHRLRRGRARRAVAATASSEQHFPQPGWVEHDAAEIWEVTRKVAIAALADAGVQGSDLKGIGITNQRETVVAWDPDYRRAGASRAGLAGPPHRRSAATSCASRHGVLELVRERTGLVIDPYFSGTKIEWLIRNGEVDGRGLRDDRLLARLQAHRPAHHRLLERLAHAAVRHPQAGLGPRALRAARRRPRARCPSPPLRPRSTERPRSSAARSPSPGSRATSRPRCSARPATRPGRPRTPTAPAASCCSTRATEVPPPRKGC